MRTAYADFDSYKIMVRALFDNWKIDYGDVMYVDNEGNSIPIKRSDINVGKASVELQALGFSPYFVYDRDHFEQAMLPPQTSNKDEQDPTYHGHGLSKEDLLKLPKLLNNPEIIMTSPVRKDFSGRDIKALEFLCKDEETSQYYKIIVAPQNIDQGHIKNKGNVNKVIFKLSEESLKKDLREIEKDKREVLYFDSSKSRKRPDHLPLKLRESEDIAKKIIGKYIPFRDKFAPRRGNMLQKAIGFYIKSKCNRTVVTAHQAPTFDNLIAEIENIKFKKALKDEIINGNTDAIGLYFKKLNTLQKHISDLIDYCYAPEKNQMHQKVAEILAEKYQKGVKELTDALKIHLEKRNQNLDKIINGQVRDDNQSIIDLMDHLDFIEDHLPEIDKEDFFINSHTFPEIAQVLRTSSDDMVKQVGEMLDETMQKCFDAQIVIDRDGRDWD